MRYDPEDPQVRANPYPHYAELRREAPVHRLEPSGIHAVSRYDDVLFALRHPELFSSDAMRTVMLEASTGADGAGPPDPVALGRIAALLQEMPFDVSELGAVRSLIAEDPPGHGVMRRVVNRGFTPRRIAALERRVRAIAREALDGAPENTALDLVETLGVPMPVAVIAELLGVEPEREMDFKTWSDALVAAGTGSFETRDPEALLRVLKEMSLYLVEVIERRRREPEDDLLTVLLEAQQGEAGLSVAEVVMFAVLLLAAGNETTTNLLSNAVLALTTHPRNAAETLGTEGLDQLRREPERIAPSIEEVLRFDSPVQALYRRVTREVELSGTRLVAGDRVMLLLGSANRDERRFADPERFDPGRNPRGHLAFGFGNHFCLGASLARLEVRVALEELLFRYPHLELVPEPLEYLESMMVRGPRRLRLEVGEARVAA